MKLKTKLLLINLMLVILVIASLAVSAVLVLSKAGEIRYNINANTFSEVESFMSEFVAKYKTMPEESKTPALLKEKLDLFDAKLQNSNTELKLLVLRGGEVLYKGRCNTSETWFAKNNVRASETFDFSIVGVTMVASQKVGSDDILFVNTFASGSHDPAKMMGIILLCCVIFIIGVVVIVYVLEYVLLIPRMYKLKEALSAIYRGDYNYQVSIKKYGRKDIIGKLAVEFELMRRQLCELNKQKEAFDRQRGEVIAGISHDLKTPLTTIQGYS